MALFRSHGIDPRSGSLTEPAPKAPGIYEQQALGFNYRMTDSTRRSASADAAASMTFVAARGGVAARYDELLADLPVVPVAARHDIRPGIYVIEVVLS